MKSFVLFQEENNGSIDVIIWAWLKIKTSSNSQSWIQQCFQQLTYFCRGYHSFQSNFAFLSCKILILKNFRIWYFVGRTQVKIWLHSRYNIRLSSDTQGDCLYDAFLSYSIQVGQPYILKLIKNKLLLNFLYTTNKNKLLYSCLHKYILLLLLLLYCYWSFLLHCSLFLQDCCIMALLASNMCIVLHQIGHHFSLFPRFDWWSKMCKSVHKLPSIHIPWNDIIRIRVSLENLMEL